MQIKLRPGEKQIKKMVIIDPIQAWGYKFKYSFKCSEVIESDDALIDLIKGSGNMK